MLRHMPYWCCVRIELKMSKLIPALAVASFVLFLLFYGACISGIVLREPDICFLLASGRWIVENGHLPSTDPFSYSTIYHDQPYVIEKWLTEVIFFLLWKWTSATGLLVFDAIVLTLTFAIMPYRLYRLSGVGGLRALLLTTLATLTSFCHLAVRPEIFSYLFAAIYLEILMRLSDANRTLHWPSVIFLVAMMVLWANLHTLFIVGLLILAFYAGCLFLEKIFRLTDKKTDWTVPVALALCIPATLITPYGFTLWQYLPNIFGPFNNTNNEMQPINMSSLTSVDMYPFFVLILVSTVVIIRKALSKPTRSGELFFKLLLPIGIIGGIKTIRTIPISDLFACAGMARILGLSKSAPTSIDEKIDQLIQPMHLGWIATSLASAGLGAYMMTTMITPEIPQGSAAFHPPLQAIEFIGKNRPPGRMLNDPHFGNVLMWQLEKAPPVFIDSRYNLYGNALLQDYWIMAENQQGSRALLEKYSIDWVFLNPQLPLIKALSKDPGWMVLYQDSNSAIVARKSQKQDK
jgi:hypothetical protein